MVAPTEPPAGTYTSDLPWWVIYRLDRRTIDRVGLVAEGMWLSHEEESCRQ